MSTLTRQGSRKLFMPTATEEGAKHAGAESIAPLLRK